MSHYSWHNIFFLLCESMILKSGYSSTVFVDFSYTSFGPGLFLSEHLCPTNRGGFDYYLTVKTALSSVNPRTRARMRFSGWKKRGWSGRSLWKSDFFALWARCSHSLFSITVCLRRYTVTYSNQFWSLKTHLFGPSESLSTLSANTRPTPCTTDSWPIIDRTLITVFYTVSSKYKLTLKATIGAVWMIDLESIGRCFAS